MASVAGDVSGNRERADALVAEAAGRGAELVLLPELALQGYDVSAACWRTAEPLGGPITRWLRDRARVHRVHLGTTLLEARGGDFHNSFVLATPAGEVAGVVGKSRPAWVEARRYRGARDGRVIETALGRIGVGICFENYLASVARELAAGHVDLVLQPTAAATPFASWPVGARGARAFETMLAGLAPAHARMAGAPVVMANMCGPHEMAGPGGAVLRTRFPGMSAVLSSDGAVLASAGEAEGVAVAAATLGGMPAGPPRGRWAVRMPWYAEAWPLVERICALGYRLDRTRRTAAWAVSPE